MALAQCVEMHPVCDGAPEPCAACEDTGLVAEDWCPLCDGYGRKDCEDMEAATAPAHRGRLLARRMMRTHKTTLTSEERMDMEVALLSNKQRRRLSQPAA